ncbi:hypothetical protein [Paenibacillus bouchesdurhonensis]|uniref:hypothetical protein n=1 Tax=Paenibacillus bouchesdurhonensis TaxID=1870990 RepID=UPI000DA5F43E|nr:hypothetical protein [Paenibacillus bouchesdurhonensis]
MVVELYDNALSLNRLMWVMSNEDFDKMIVISKLHISLVSEHINSNTTPERKREIIREIELLRDARDQLFIKYLNQSKGEIEK